MCLALAAGTARAAAPADGQWPEVARSTDGECTLSVTGNGQFYRIAASGLGPSADSRFVLSNGDMKPLDWSTRASGEGDFARYYLPFRWHRAGDPIRVTVQSERCALSTTFEWSRARGVVR
jgi:hypothetical protein